MATALHPDSAISDITPPLTVPGIIAAPRGWRPWHGGARPVSGHTLVQVRCAFETDYDDDQMPRRASSWNWSGMGDILDITAFKVVD